jgi:SlyX protein
MADAAARMTEIETALAHQERQAEELSEVIRAQDQRLDALERRLALMIARLIEIEAGDAGPRAPDVRPPHW